MSTFPLPFSDATRENIWNSLTKAYHCQKKESLALSNKALVKKKAGL